MRISSGAINARASAPSRLVAKTTRLTRPVVMSEVAASAAATLGASTVAAADATYQMVSAKPTATAEQPTCVAVAKMLTRNVARRTCRKLGLQLRQPAIP